MTKSNLYILLIMLALMTALTQSTHAVCLDPVTFDSGYHVPLNEEIQSIRQIAIGEVIKSRYLQEDSTDPDGITAYIYTVRVLRLLKGQLPEVIELRDENDSGRYMMEVGERHLLFLSREGQYFKVNSCGNSSPLILANDVLKQVESILANSEKEP